MQKEKWPLYHIPIAWLRMQNPVSTEGNESFALVGELAAVGLEDRKVPSIFFFFIDLHPRRPRGSQSGREKRRDESFQVRAKEPLGTDSHRTISKKFKSMIDP